MAGKIWIPFGATGEKFFNRCAVIQHVATAGKKRGKKRGGGKGGLNFAAEEE